MNRDLTPQEWHVTQLLAWGYLNREIGELLNIQTKTVETYRANIYEKLHIKSRREIYQYVKWRLSCTFTVILPVEYCLDLVNCFIDADIYTGGDGKSSVNWYKYQADLQQPL